MPFQTDHPAFAWLGKPALSLDVYASAFGGAAIEIMGESPYLNAKGAGISLALKKDHTVPAAFLYADGVEEFAQYAGALPAGLSFNSSRADVRAALGEPAMRADAGGVGIMAIDHAFDRFEDDIFYLRFVYAAGETTIRHVTFGHCNAG